MIVKQLPMAPLENFSYIVGCPETRTAVVIDPGEDVDTIAEAARSDHLIIRYIFNTHHHWDHIAGNSALKNSTGAELVMHALEDDIVQGRVPKINPGSRTSPPADIRIEGQKTFTVGRIAFDIFFTPGHTPGGMCLHAEGHLLTGDTLFVGDSGRTDLPGGHRPTLGASIRKLMRLPDETVVWPGHDYGSSPQSTIGREKRTNINAREYGFYIAD